MMNWEWNYMAPSEREFELLEGPSGQGSGVRAEWSACIGRILGLHGDDLERDI